MVKDHVLSNCEECNRARIPIFTYMVHDISKKKNYKGLCFSDQFYCVIQIGFVSRPLPVLFALNLVSCFYGVVCTTQNGGDKA